MGFNCEAAGDKVSEYLDKIQDSRTTTDDDITVGYRLKNLLKQAWTVGSLEINPRNIRKL